MSDVRTPRAAIPSVDRLLRSADAMILIDGYGRQAVTEAVRDDLAAMGVVLEDGPQGTTWKKS